MPSPHLRRIRLPLLALMLSCSSEWSVANSASTEPPAVDRGSEAKTLPAPPLLPDNLSTDDLIQMALESARAAKVYGRPRNLYELAEAFALAGKMPLARSTYLESCEAARKIEDWDFRREASRNIAASHIYVGLTEEALQFASSINERDERDEIYKEIALAEIDKNRPDLALQAAANIQITDWKAHTLKEICLYQIQQQQFGEALQTARKCPPEVEKVVALAAVAKAFHSSTALPIDANSLKAADILQEAIEVVTALEYPSQRDRASAEIATAQAHLHGKENARKIIENTRKDKPQLELQDQLKSIRSMPVEKEKTEELSRLAYQLSKLGEMSPVLKVLQQIDDVTNRRRATIDIVHSLANERKFDQAEMIMSSISPVDDQFSDHLLYVTSRVQAGTGKLDEALETSKLIPKDSHWKGSTLANIVQEQGQRGKTMTGISLAKDLPLVDRHQVYLKALIVILGVKYE